MSDLVLRIKTSLEPILDQPDPRQRISAYHDMPYALFRYDPEEEFNLRTQIRLLETRLTQKGKRISRISLAQCLDCKRGYCERSALEGAPLSAEVLALERRFWQWSVRVS